MRATILVMVLVMVLAPITPALAQTGGTSGGGVIKLCNPLGATCDSTTTPAQLLDRILTYLLQLGAIIGAIMIIIGAYQILFAGGDPEKFVTGRRTIVYTAIAYGILLMAKGIVLIVKDFLT